MKKGKIMMIFSPVDYATINVKKKSLEKHMIIKHASHEIKECKEKFPSYM